MKTILITGATGFIGSWLTQSFLEKKIHIIAHGSSKETLMNLRYKINEKNNPKGRLDYWEQNFFEEKWNFPDFTGIDYIIHCAALTSVRKGTKGNYDNYLKVNVIATKLLAQRALDEDVSHFIHLSSGQIYGKPDEFPINESTPKEPINIYGFSKLMSEEVIKSFGTLGLNYSIVRPFSVYGKGQTNIISIIRDKITNNQTLTIFGDGNQTRAFMHIKDICNAIELVLGNDDAFQKEFNLSGPKEYSVNELVNLISQKLNRSTKIVYKESGVDELQRNIADTSKIQNLGFSYQHFLDDFIDQWVSD